MYTKNYGTQQSWRTYPDGAARQLDGRFGQGAWNPSSSSSAGLRYEYPLPENSYYIGEVRCDLNSRSGFVVSTEKKYGDLYTWPVNKNLSELSSSFISPEILSSLKNSLQSCGCNIDRIKVKEIAIEGPAMSGGVNMTHTALGAKAHAQLAAVRMVLETPTGNISVKVKGGLGYGREVSAESSRSGKAFLGHSQTITTGIFEIKFEQGGAASVLLDARAPAPSSDEASRTIGRWARWLEPTGIYPGSSRLLPGFIPTSASDLPHHSSRTAEPSPAATSRHSSHKSSPVAAATSSKQDILDSGSDRSLTREQEHLMNDAVGGIADQLQGDAKVVALHKAYQESPDKTSAFVQFGKDLKQHQVSEQNFQHITQAVNNTSVVLSQVAQLSGNHELGKFAGGLGAAMQTISGMRTIGNAVSLMGSASSIGSMATFGSLMGGAGLVLGGISMIASIFSDDEEDGLGEALSEIHSAIMGMWSEMRQSFQEIRIQLDAMQHSIEVMERNNVERFKATITAIEKTRTDILFAIESSHRDVVQQLARFRQSTEGYLASIQHEMRSYCELLVDQKMNSTIQDLRIGSPQEIQLKLTKHIRNAFNWLTQAACIEVRTGFMELSHGQLAMNPDVRIRTLESFTAAERPASNIPLGFFVSIAREIVPDIFAGYPGHLVLINPRGWGEILSVYLHLVRIMKNNQSVVAEGYFAQLNEISNIIDSTLFVMERITNSVDAYHGLWSKLIDRYQRSFYRVYHVLNGLVSDEIKPEVRAAFIREQQEELIPELRQHYLELVAFVHLIEPLFLPRKISFAFEGIMHDLNLMLTTKTDENRKSVSDSLLQKLGPDLWKEPLRGYLGKECADFDQGTLGERLPKSLEKNPFWRMMEHAKSIIDPLKHDFAPSRFASIMSFQQEIMQQHAIQATAQTALPGSAMRAGMTVQERIQQDVRDTEIAAIQLAQHQLAAKKQTALRQQALLEAMRVASQDALDLLIEFKGALDPEVKALIAEVRRLTTAMDAIENELRPLRSGAKMSGLPTQVVQVSRVNDTRNIEEALKKSFDVWGSLERIPHQRASVTVPPRYQQFRVIRVPADGNCFFHAVAALLGERENAAILRAKATQHIIEHLQEFAGFSEKSLDAFIEALSTPGEWADHPSVLALAQSMNLNFEIHHSNDVTPNTVIYSGKSNARTLHLLYNGVHYDALQ